MTKIEIVETKEKSLKDIFAKAHALASTKGESMLLQVLESVIPCVENTPKFQDLGRALHNFGDLKDQTVGAGISNAMLIHAVVGMDMAVPIEETCSQERLAQYIAGLVADGEMAKHLTEGRVTVKMAYSIQKRRREQ